MSSPLPTDGISDLTSQTGSLNNNVPEPEPKPTSEDVSTQMKLMLMLNHNFILDLGIENPDEKNRKKLVGEPEEILNTHVNQLVEKIGKKLDTMVTLMDYCEFPWDPKDEQTSEESSTKQSALKLYQLGGVVSEIFPQIPSSPRY